MQHRGSITLKLLFLIFAVSFFGHFHFVTWQDAIYSFLAFVTLHVVSDHFYKTINGRLAAEQRKKAIEAFFSALEDFLPTMVVIIEGKPEEPQGKGNQPPTPETPAPNETPTD